MPKSVLITGANGGFGKLTVNTLLKKGHTVIATMRDINGRNSETAQEFEQAGAHVLEMDVTSESSVEAAINEAISKAGKLDVVVNNAGVGVLGMQEHFTTEDFQKLFDINVFGVQRVTRAVLAHMRERGEGLLLNVSSLLGRMALPFYGPYNASKWALEALTENYRVELSGFGVDACVVEPGGYATGFMHALMRPSDTSRNEAYGEYANAPQQMFDGFEGALGQNPEQNPQKVADAIANVIDTPAGERPMRTVVDSMGMGDHINAYNGQLDQITAGIYDAFGMADMLKLKTLQD